jgi:phospholipid/cholesterol/gamma-HCH transport system permease protein
MRRTYSIFRTERLVDALQGLGAMISNGIIYTGGITLMFLQACWLAVTTPPKWNHIFAQINRIGVLSTPLVMLTALFTGIVLSLQSAYQLKLFSATQYVADLVSLSLCRELGPVLTAMVVGGRVGAAIAAELGTMKVTEQIDAMESMGVDPIRFLVVPRLVAAVIGLFLLTVYADIIGILGGYIVSVTTLEISHDQFMKGVLRALTTKDVITGLIKSLWFGVIISIVGCYFGFRARGGAEGVGMATTLSVVTSLLSIIAFDALFTGIFYFMS